MAQTILLSGVGKSTCVLNPSFLEMCIVNTLCHMCAKKPGQLTRCSPQSKFSQSDYSCSARDRRRIL